MVSYYGSERTSGCNGGHRSNVSPVKVPDDQCSFLRFLWWEDCDTNTEIIEYEMTAHVFGGASSPSCSNFALRKTARDNSD